MRILILLFLAGIVVSCNSNPSAKIDSTQSVSDSLLNEVLAVHDIAMPKMMKLERQEKQAQAEIDSLKKKPGAYKERIKKLDSLINNLSKADGAMHAWMEGFKYDSLKDNTTQREAYLKSQLESVHNVKELVVSGVQKADSVLAK